MKLTGKIMLLLLAVVILITTVAGTLSVQAAYADIEARQQALARELASQMQERLVTAWRQSGQYGVIRAVREWALESEQPLVARLVVFSDDAAKITRPQAPLSIWNNLSRSHIVSIVTVDADGNRRLHTYLRMPELIGETSALEITEPLTALDQQTRQLVTGTLLSIGTTALIGLVLAYVAGVRWVARPLQLLIEQTERIGRGDFSQRLTLHGGDELDQLAEALNAMSDRLAAQQATIARETADRLNTLQQLRHVDRLGTLGRMAAGIAHELGTPLNVVAGRAALIASGRLSAEEVKASARTIKSEADRITSIVQRLLDFARGRRPQRVECELAATVQRTVSLLESLARKRDVQLELQTPSVPTKCYVDESQIQQVITNLIVNAVQATPANGRVRLNIDTPEEGWLRVRVEDSGPGVPEELRERIFEPFFTTKDVGEGTGLGLSIAYGIVQEHGGRLEVSQGELGGAAFDVWLPQTLEPASAISQEQLIS